MMSMTRTTKALQSLGGRAAAVLAALFLAFLPELAMAGEANVTLKFSAMDQLYLKISLVFGLVAIVVAL